MKTKVIFSPKKADLLRPLTFCPYSNHAILLLSVFYSLMIFEQNPYNILAQIPRPVYLSSTLFGLCFFIAFLLIYRLLPGCFKNHFLPHHYSPAQHILLFCLLWLFVSIELSSVKYLSGRVQASYAGLLFDSLHHSISVGTTPFLFLQLLLAFVEKQQVPATAVVVVPTHQQAAISTKHRNKMPEPGQLLYIEGKGNTKTLFYLEKETVHSQQLRSSNTQLMKDYSGSICFIQCHQSILINANMIDHEASKKYSDYLILKNCPTPLPISRRKKKEVMQQLKQQEK